MKKVKIIISLMVITFFISVAANAQKITLKSGDLSFLKEISELNVEYDYSEMAVGKFKTEEAYIEKKKKDLDKKEAGSGDAWEADWHEGKDQTFKRKFEDMFNLTFFARDVDIHLGEFTNADYTLILKTTFMEPGYNIGISSKNASINVEVVFVKTDDKETPIALITMSKVPGYGFFGADFDMEYRVGEAYGKAGDELATYLWKKVLK
jgi:hypothetical protein